MKPNPGGFDHVNAWIFDLDNTLYPADCNLFAEIDARMSGFIAERIGLSLEAAQALRKRYYYEYGTTLAGLMRLHDVCPDTFLDYVHDIDLSVVAPAPELARALGALPGRKFIFTNGSRKHAEAIAERLGLIQHFEDVFDIRAADFTPKPDPAVYERFTQLKAISGHDAAMFDDLPQNLKPAHALGMTTVLVASGMTEHPEHQAIAGWTKLPVHVHYRVDALAPFLSAICSSERRRGSAPPLWGRDREGGSPRRAPTPPSALRSAEPAPPQGGSKEPAAILRPDLHD